jgi:APA family basic amino acid/polyamine antiporter
MRDPNRLRPVLTLWQVTISGVGIVIGAGIYVLIGSAAEQAGNALWISFIVAALMSTLTGLSYAELASMFPSASGEYEFARRAYNEFVGFIAGWVMILANVIAAAAVSIGFGKYVQHFVAIDPPWASLALLIVLTLVVMGGVHRSIWLSTLLVVLQVGGLLLVIAAGVPHLGQFDLLEGGSIGGVLGASALIFFAFIGFDEVITLSEDTRDPERSIPRALLLALGISTLLYVVVGISAVSVLGGEALAGSDRPLALVIAHDWGSSAAGIVALIALASTMNTTLLVLTAATRLIYGMAGQGSLPRWLASVGRNRRAPQAAALAVLPVALVFVVLSDIEMAASVTDFGVYVVFILVNLSVLVLRLRSPGAPRRFRIPFDFLGVPVPPVLALGSVIMLMGFLKFEAWLIGLACLALGCLVWLVRRAFTTTESLS